MFRLGGFISVLPPYLLTTRYTKVYLFLTNYSQMKPKRTRKKTSTKVMFTFRVEHEQVETLKEIAIYLNNLKLRK